MGNPVVHFEVLGKDVDAMSRFYGDIFGWQIESIPEMRYGMVNTGAGATAIGGGIGSPENGASMVTFYVEVPDINAHLEKIEAAGGKTMMPRTELGMVTIAMFTDPEGHAVGLVEAGSDQNGGQQA